MATASEGRSSAGTGKAALPAPLQEVAALFLRLGLMTGMPVWRAAMEGQRCGWASAQVIVVIMTIYCQPTPP
jgi:hypothetical protein